MVIMTYFRATYNYLQLYTYLRHAGAGAFFRTNKFRIKSHHCLYNNQVWLISFCLKEENILKVGLKPDFQNINFRR